MAVDNSGDPKPLINEKGTIIGLLIPFMVSSPTNDYLVLAISSGNLFLTNDAQVVQWICISLRFWTRTKLHSLGYDDAFVLIAVVSRRASGGP